ncbi:MAG: hypothetical protein ACFE95_16015 [Candidatus Hodarchaeota archaeon]
MAVLKPEQITLLRNPRYLSLVKILHEKGPLTLEEIAKKYAERAEKEQAKSKSTVYLYLTLLKQNNIIHEAGQRITEGKTISRTLYSLTAKYMIVDEPEIDWEETHGRWVFKELLKILKIFYPNKTINEKALFQWQLHVQHIVNEDKQKLINSKDHEILEILSVWAPYSINDIIEFLGWISVLLKYPNAQLDFLKCFNDSPESTTVTLSSSNDITRNNIIKKARDVQDIFRQLPDFFFVLPKNDPRRKYTEKPGYIPLFHVLRDGPMTINEIVEKYNQVAFVPRKRSTIYRYIKTLKDAKLVIEIGQRVIHGKKATQKLYGPVARVISFQDIYDPEWKSEPRVWLLNSLIRLLSFLHPKLPQVNKQCFREFRVSASHYSDSIEGIQKFSVPENRRAFELLQTYNWRDFYSIYSSFWDYYFFMTIPNLCENLRTCFTE